MDDMLKLVRTFRVMATLTDRLRLSDAIFTQIEPDLRFFVFGAIRPPAAEDVLQEILKGIATGMGKFRGDTKEQFWAWCYTIARNNLI
jgi:DNA-directed RNA polymerase specialized sigma24 family protein